LLDYAEQEGRVGQRCELTGIKTDFDFYAVCANALGQAGSTVPEQKWLGRDWIPLGGSLGNGAQALPGASRSMRVPWHYLLSNTFLSAYFCSKEN
jgi:hypothetical protein